jgi:hypothetical protein
MWPSELADHMTADAETKKARRQLRGPDLQLPLLGSNQDSPDPEGPL